MDAVKRSRFATKQMRAGPAPLASFEDLPSDELESPEDYSHIKTYACSIDDESTSRDLQFTTPDSLTISSQSTPRIESDFDSHFTLTPGDSYQGQSTSDLRTASLSSLSKDDSTLNVKQKKGSAASLGTLESTEAEYTHRKSSWTDIFRSHNQSSAKTTTSTTLPVSVNEKSTKKKPKSDHSKKDSESKSKDKGKFLSIFKKKSNKQINSPVVADNHILPDESLNVTECLDDNSEDVSSIKVSNNKTSKGKENESPTNKEPNQPPFEVQNDLGKINSGHCDKIPDERRLSRKVINIPEKIVDTEYNIVSKQIAEIKVDQISKIDDIESSTVDVKEEVESSESEVTSELKDVQIEKKEDDFEAEILLPHDEIEEDSVIELRPVTFEISKQIMIPSKQQRLEITTKPIDRPRSTTPINVAPLEAFIQSVSPTFDPKVEKIKLSLPGEQFLGRMKSPKKSTKSWRDFCERGLHSPRMHRKFDKENQKSPFKYSEGTSLSSHEQSFSENWAAFESDFTSLDSNVFEDNFSVNFSSCETAQNQASDNKSYQYFESDFSFNSNSTGCATCKFVNCELAQSSDQCISVVPCKDCSCECHSKQNSNIKSPEFCSNIDVFGASKTLRLVTDEQF